MGRGKGIRKGHLTLVHSIDTPEEAAETKPERLARLKVASDKRVERLKNTYKLVIRITHYKNPSKRYRAVNVDRAPRISVFAASMEEAIEKLEKKIGRYHAKKVTGASAPIFEIKDETKPINDDPLKTKQNYDIMSKQERLDNARKKLDASHNTYKIKIEETASTSFKRKRKSFIATVRGAPLRDETKTFKAESKIHAEVAARQFIYEYQDRHRESRRPIIYKVDSFED